MSNLRRIAGRLATILGIVAASVFVPVLVGSASAHHPEIEASVGCSGVVNFTTTAWDNSNVIDYPLDTEFGGDKARTNSDILVWYVANGSASIVPIVHGSFSAGNGFSFGGSFTWPASNPTSIEIFAQAQVLWQSGSAAGDSRSTTVLRPDECPSNPAATSKAVCVAGDGGIAVTFTNPGPFGQPVTFSVTNPASADVTVQPGGSVTVTYGGLEDGQRTISINIGETDYSQTQTVFCKFAIPSASVKYECVNGFGDVTFTLVNDGYKSETFVINFDGQTVEVDVAANSTTTESFTGLDLGDYPATVTAGETLLIDDTVTVACDRPGTPKVSLTTDCANLDGTAAILLENNGGQLPITFVINGIMPGYVVNANSSLTVNRSGFTDGPHTITITAKGFEQNFNKTFTTKCNVASTVQVAGECDVETNDGQAVITLSNNNDDKSVVFTINGEDYTVDPSSTSEVVFGPYNDGDHSITYQIDGAPAEPLSLTFTIKCDEPGVSSISLSLECINGDGSVTITLGNEGGDLPITFVVNGDTYIVAVGDTTSVVVDGLADGGYSPIISVNGEAYEISIDVVCDTIGVTAVCNEINTDDEVTGYWFTLTNNDDTDTLVSWNGGKAELQPHTSTNVLATSAPLALVIGEQKPLLVPASEETCRNDVTVEKKLQGQPPTGETYTVKVSRLDGDTYIEETTFTIDAGVTKTFSLPSTLNPQGITYKVEETDPGSSTFHTVSPDSFALSGHKGESVSVVITNSYASVSIDKTVSAIEVAPGKTLTYTLVGTNTGGATLNNVIITDRLPVDVTFTSVSIVGNAGLCNLSETTQPQFLVCSMNGTLAPGAKTAAITLVVTVDADAAKGTTLQNTARILGSYTDPDGSEKPISTEINCLPIPDGTVCDLSAAVGTVVRDSGSGGPTTTTTIPGQLPRTGGGANGSVLLVAALSVLSGVLLVAVRRRPARR